MFGWISIVFFLLFIPCSRYTKYKSNHIHVIGIWKIITLSHTFFIKTIHSMKQSMARTTEITIISCNTIILLKLPISHMPCRKIDRIQIVNKSGKTHTHWMNREKTATNNRNDDSTRLEYCCKKGDQVATTASGIDGRFSFFVLPLCPLFSSLLAC